MAEQQVKVAEAQVNARQTDLTDMVVRAPFDGIAISKDAQPGEMISPVSAGGGFTRTGICTIVDMSSLEIEVDVSETYINRVHSAQRGRGGARRLRRLEDPGARDHDDPVGGPSEGDGQGADRVRRAGPAHPAGHGRQGVVPAGRGSAPSAAAAPAAPRMVVPKAAVRTIDGRTVVFVAKDDHVERRAITVGGENGGQVDVLSGLTAGERVVLDAAAGR